MEHLTTKARKSKPTHIERILPLSRVVEFFRQRFHDPYLNPEAEASLGELQSAFPEITHEELDEALNHWVMHPGAKVLSTKTTDVNGHQTQVWFIHGLHEEFVPHEGSYSA